MFCAMLDLCLGGGGGKGLLSKLCRMSYQWELVDGWALNLIETGLGP